MTVVAIWLLMLMLETFGGMAAAPSGPDHNFLWLIGIQTAIMVVCATAEIAYLVGRKNR